MNLSFKKKNRVSIILSQPCNANGSMVLNLIVILIVTGVIGVTLMSLTSTSFVQQVHSDSSQRAELLAESGFRYLAARYKQASDSSAKNNVLKSIHGNTFVLNGNDGRFTLGVYPYVYMVRTAASAGATQLQAEFFGSKPDGLTIPASGTIGILTGSKYTLYSYTAYTGNNQQFTFTNLTDTSDLSSGLNNDIPLTSTVYPVFTSEVKVLTSGSGNSLTVPGSGTFMPSADGVFEIINNLGERKDANSVRTRIYTYKTRTGNVLNDITEYSDPSASFSLSLTTGTRIVVHKSAEIRSTGTVNAGTVDETNRIMNRLTALGYILPQVDAGELIYDTAENRLQALIGSATVMGDADMVSNGKIGSAMVFDGDMDYVRLNDDSTLDLTTAGSIGAWVKVTAFDNNFAGIIRKGGLAGDSDLAYSLEFRAGRRIKLKIVGTSSSLELDSASTLSTGIWYHVAGTWGPAGMAIYIDGKLDSSQASTLTVRNTTGTVQIGAQLDEIFNPSQKNYGFHGILDEVFIFNTQKNLCEIREIYSNPCTIGCDAYAYYPFNGSYEDGGGGDKNGNDTRNGTSSGASFGTDRFGCSQRSCQLEWWDFVEISSESDFDFTSSFTLSIWVRVSYWTMFLGNDPFVSKGTNSYRIGRYNNTNYANFGTTGLSAVNTYGNDNVGNGAWHHIVAVYNSSRKDIYVDGVRDDFDSVTGSLSQNNTRLRFGSTWVLAIFTGWVDDAGFWNRALNETEIANIYRGIRTDPSFP